MKITTETIQEFMDMLTGEGLPEGMRMNSQPALEPDAAFSVIWYLQEHLLVLPDNFEMCGSCKTIYDTDYGGYYVSDDSDIDEWYDEVGVTREMLKENTGGHFCSAICEYDFWMHLPEKEAQHDILSL